jgi:hypothetical protein
VAPDVNGLSGFDGLSAEEESIRQVARRPPRPLPPSRIYAPTRVAHPGDAPPRRPAAPPPRRPAAPPPPRPAPPPRRPAAPPRRAKEARGPHAPGNTRTCHAGATTQERLRAHVRVGADDAARHGRRALAPQASRLGGFPGAKPAEDAHPGRREPNGLRTSIAPRSI